MMDAEISVSEAPTPSAVRRAPRARIDPRYVQRHVEHLVGDDLHAKRVLSLANGVVGVIHGAALAVHCIGAGLAAAMGTDPKHAIVTAHVR